MAKDGFNFSFVNFPFMCSNILGVATNKCVTDPRISSRKVEVTTSKNVMVSIITWLTITEY
jgi:hypothetical protein